MRKKRNFHGHSTVVECQGCCRVVTGSWQGRGRVAAGSRQGNGTVCVNRSLKRKRNSKGTAWEQQGMCESALTSHTHIFAVRMRKYAFCLAASCLFHVAIRLASN
jgi:hypothetical protein